jgi:hypothetical protein
VPDRGQTSQAVQGCDAVGSEEGAAEIADGFRDYQAAAGQLS